MTGSLVALMRRARVARRAFNAPRHPLQKQLAEKLLPAVCEYSAIDRQQHAQGVARMLLEMWERQHQRWRDER